MYPLQALTLLKVKIAEQKQKEKQTWGGLLKSVSAKKEDSDDENDGHDENVSSTQNSTRLSTGQSTTFWVAALMILALAAFTGFLLTS
jgi:replication-associated recombination protein RarA